jgi:hypothetical protein
MLFMQFWCRFVETLQNSNFLFLPFEILCFSFLLIVKSFEVHSISTSIYTITRDARYLFKNFMELYTSMTARKHIVADVQIE